MLISLRCLQLFAVSVCTTCFSLHTLAQCAVSALKCEYLLNPIGIDAAKPRLSWQLQDSRRGARQAACEVIVGTDSIAVAKGTGNIWQTDRMNKDLQLLSYGGKALTPFTKYFWTVKVWDKDGKPSTIQTVASFETGMIQQGNWKGAWISDSRDVNIKPAP